MVQPPGSICSTGTKQCSWEGAVMPIKPSHGRPQCHISPCAESTCWWDATRAAEAVGTGFTPVWPTEYRL